MFQSYVGEVPGFILAELIAPSIEILTANRDGFRDYPTQRAVESLAERIAKDNMSALKSKQGLIRQKFEGTGKFKAKERASMVLDQIGPYGAGELSSQEHGDRCANHEQLRAGRGGSALVDAIDSRCPRDARPEVSWSQPS